jgi:hypothetical protein
MLSLTAKQLFSRRVVARRFLDFRVVSTSTTTIRSKSSSRVTEESSETDGHNYAFDKDGEARTDTIQFPTVDRESPSYNIEEPILLNAKEHAVGYLSRVLNARVYEAAVETDLQHAKNLSSVRHSLFDNNNRNSQMFHVHLCSFLLFVFLQRLAPLTAFKKHSIAQT